MFTVAQVCNRIQAQGIDASKLTKFLYRCSFMFGAGAMSILLLFGFFVYPIVLARWEAMAQKAIVDTSVNTLTLATTKDDLANCKAVADNLVRSLQKKEKAFAGLGNGDINQ